MAIDDNTVYGLTGAQIKELPGKIEAVKGLAKELTTDDYNWPANNPDGIAIWLLEPGVYKGATSGIKIYEAANNIDSNGRRIYILSRQPEVRGGFLILDPTTDAISWAVTEDNGTSQHRISLGAPVDNLTSTSTASPLSANQGKILKGLIDAISQSGAGAPTTSTVGTVGQLYQDTTNGKLYICTDATNPYVWEEVGAGGGGITELTTADYDYPTGNPDGIAMWKLPAGSYKKPAGVRVYITTSVTRSSYEEKYEVKENNSSGRTIFQLTPTYITSGGDYVSGPRVYDVNGFGAGRYGSYSLNEGFVITSDRVQDNLTTPSSVFNKSMVLSANQGRVLKSQIGDLTTLDTTVQTDLVSAINEIAGSAGGGVTVLTTDDYNITTSTWTSTANNDAVAAWLLPDGLYNLGDLSGFRIYFAKNQNIDINASFYPNFQVISSGDDKILLGFGNNSASTTGLGLIKYAFTRASDGAAFILPVSIAPIVTQSTGTSQTSVMSQNATTGMVFADPSTRQRVQISGSSTGTRAIAIGASSTSSAHSSIAIGNTAKAGQQSAINVGSAAEGTNGANSDGGIAIGLNTQVPYPNAGGVALGAYSGGNISAPGMVDIGSSNTSYGYSSSNYRLLTGLYDPQSAHDAATKGYVDGLVGNISTVLQTLISGTGATGA